MEKRIIFERGDSIKFGEQWCKEHSYEHLIGQTIMMTPQWFEYDDDLGGGYQECPGMVMEEGEDPESIYHLFGNHFENLMDCEHVKGTDEDKAAYKKIIKDAEEAEAKAWEKFMSEEHDYSHIDG